MLLTVEQMLVIVNCLAKGAASKSLLRWSGIIMCSCRFPISPSSAPTLFSRRNVDVRVAADYSDSKPESHKRQDKWGYHPLEDLSKVEKDEIEHAGEGKLTIAEVARTISEVFSDFFVALLIQCSSSRAPSKYSNRFSLPHSTCEAFKRVLMASAGIIMSRRFLDLIACQVFPQQ